MRPGASKLKEAMGMDFEVGSLKGPSLPETAISSQELARRGKEEPGRDLPKVDHKAQEDEPRRDKNSIRGIVETLNDLASALNRSFRFEYVEEIDRFWVKVVDRRTHRVIREIPPGQIVELFKRIRETLGVLFDEFF